MTIATGICTSRPSISTNTCQEPEVTLTLATDKCPTVAFYVAPAKSSFMSQDASSFFFLGGEHDEGKITKLQVHLADTNSNIILWRSMESLMKNLAKVINNGGSELPQTLRSCRYL